jgi:hypothetical protein
MTTNRLALLFVIADLAVSSCGKVMQQDPSKRVLDKSSASGAAEGSGTPGTDNSQSNINTNSSDPTEPTDSNGNVIVVKLAPLQLAIPIECCRTESSEIFLRQCIAFDKNACDAMIK